LLFVALDIQLSILRRKWKSLAAALAEVRAIVQLAQPDDPRFLDVAGRSTIAARYQSAPLTCSIVRLGKLIRSIADVNLELIADFRRLCIDIDMQFVPIGSRAAALFSNILSCYRSVTDFARRLWLTLERGVKASQAAHFAARSGSCHLLQISRGGLQW
jgi:hypothetical protein